MNHSGSEICPICISEKQKLIAMRIEEAKAEERIKDLSPDLIDVLKRLKSILEKPAGNHKFMQIAEPARRCLNIINEAIKKDIQ